MTIGHSHQSIDEFLQLLQAHQVSSTADARKMPGLRHDPQFGRDALAQSLRRIAVDYVHLPGLGGVRPHTPDSPKGGWKNAPFEGYADDMLTPELEGSFEKLLSFAVGEGAALMCAEAVPWRCRRSLIADAPVVRGVSMERVSIASRTRTHLLHSWARVEGPRITYPPTAAEGDEEVQETGTGR